MSADSLNQNKLGFLNLLYEIDDLESAAYLLMWDQATYMPPGGAAARARQSATLQGLAHQKLIDPAFGKALAAFEQYADNLQYDSDDAGLARVTRRKYERAILVPADFTYEFTEHAAATFSTWAEARPANDFARVQPYLEKTLELSRRYADFFPGYDHPADPLIDRHDHGMSVATISPIFVDLRDFLSSFIKRIKDTGLEYALPATTKFDTGVQQQIGADIAKRFGYDFRRGRLDLTHHPFMIKFSLGDARITSRFFEHNLAGIFGTMHESGHAMYEQGIDFAYERTPLADGTSSAVHESQSRSWENLVGRSRGFWKGFYPELQNAFPDALNNVGLDEFYQAINRVSSNLIRVDADEVTYALHIIIRFELEQALLEGALSIADLPEAWNAKYSDYLGVVSPDYRDGVMQDVHWYTDFIGGMFQGYQLGNVLASQFYAVALDAHPEIPSDIEQGRFTTLLTWLQENIYRHGSKYTTLELVERITGGGIDTAPYKQYLIDKFEDNYKLN